MKRAFPALLLCLGLMGCAAKQTVTNVPAGVPVTQVQEWDQAVQALGKFDAATSTLRQTVITLNKSTFVNPAGQTVSIFPDGPAYEATLAGIGKVDQLEIQAAQFLNSVPNSWGASTQTQVANYMQQITAALGNLVQESTLGIKNPTSQTQVQQLINELTSLASVVVSLT